MHCWLIFNGDFREKLSLWNHQEAKGHLIHITQINLWFKINKRSIKVLNLVSESVSFYSFVSNSWISMFDIMSLLHLKTGLISNQWLSNIPGLISCSLAGIFCSVTEHRTRPWELKKFHKWIWDVGKKYFLISQTKYNRESWKFLRTVDFPGILLPHYRVYLMRKIE